MYDTINAYASELQCYRVNELKYKNLIKNYEDGNAKYKKTYPKLNITDKGAEKGIL